MVKHHARKILQGLHTYLMDRETKDKERLEKQAKKREEKRQQMAVDNAGEGGEVKALDGMKFKGSFGVDFDKSRTMDDVEMESEDVVKMCKSVRKQHGFEVARKNYLIKKKAKKERKVETRRTKAKMVIKKKKGGKNGVRKMKI